MDQQSPGYFDSNNQQVPDSTFHCFNTMSTETQSQDAAPLSTNRSKMRNTTAGSADIGFVSSNSAPGLLSLSTHGQGRQCGSTPHAIGPLPDGHLGHVQQKRPLPQIPSNHGSTLQASYRNRGLGQARNATEPTPYRPFDRENQQPIALGRGYQQSGAGRPFDPSSGREHDLYAVPSSSAQPSYDPKELFLLEGSGPYAPAASVHGDGGHGGEVLPKFLPQPDYGTKELLIMKGNRYASAADVTAAARNGGGRSQEIQPSLSPQPDFSPRPDHDPDELFFFKGGPYSAAADSVRDGRTEGTRYYDYSEGFDNSSTWSPHMATRPTLVASPDPIEPRGIQMPRGDGEKDFPHPDEAHQYHFANLPIHGGGGQMKHGQPAYSNRGGQLPPSYSQPPRTPTREYAHDETGGAHPQGLIPHKGLPPYQPRGGDPRAHPYPRGHRMAYQGGSGYRGGHRNYGGYHGEQHDAGRYHRERSDAGGYHRLPDADRHYRNRRDAVDNSSNQENMPPVLTRSLRRAEPPSRETSRARHNIAQAHRKVQEMMRTWIPRGQGQGLIDEDGASIHLSRPIPLASPRPVSSNTRQRLAKHILSINDDDTLPDEFRNLHRGQSGSSDMDGLSDANSHRLAPAEPLGFGRNGLHRPHEAPKVVQGIRGKDASGNIRAYATPRNLGPGRKKLSRRRTPCPAEIPTEPEYRGNVQVEPELDSNADSRNIVLSEHNRWEAAKDKIESAKESVFARLHIKTKRVRNTAAFGHMLLARGAEKAIPGFSHSNNAYAELHDSNITRIEQWIEHSGGDDGGTDDMRNQMDGSRSNVATGAGHSATCPGGLRERLTHMKERAFRQEHEGHR